MKIVLIILYRVFIVFVVSIITSLITYRVQKSRELNTDHAVIYGILFAIILVMAAKDFIPMWYLG